MPFRAAQTSGPSAPSIDPFDRFAALYDALRDRRGFFTDHVPLRLAACTLITTPGDAKELAAEIRRVDEVLKARLSFFTSFTAPLRLLIAATLVKAGDDPARFMDAAEEVRRLFRQHRVRRGGAYEYLAAFVLRRLNSGGPVTSAQVLRFKALYEAMRRYHVWLTGPEDFPACAMLVPTPGTPAEIGYRIELIYQALRKHADLWRGDPLQTAANILVLSGLEPVEVARRFRRIADGFEARNVRIRQRDYDEVSLLCFVAQPVEMIVDSVIRYKARVHGAFRWINDNLAFSLGTSLAFVRLVAGHQTLEPLSEAKLLIDMQGIIATRQGAAAS